jgi:hypothetical protein
MKLEPIEGAAWVINDYPWDRWERHARARGVGAELAQLGRSVMREAYQHQWAAMIARRYGWAAVDVDQDPNWMQVPGAPPGVRALRPGASMRWPVDEASCEAMIAHALAEPSKAHDEWDRDLETDGGHRWAADWKDDAAADAGDALRWYRRPEAFGEGWILAACSSHGAELLAHRFKPGRTAALQSPPPRCPLCDGTATMEEVRRCLCETTPYECPVHHERD